MTELSNLLENLGDQVFKVKFHKKIDVKDISDRLKSVKLTDINNDKTLNSLVKELNEGELCEITGHLI